MTIFLLSSSHKPPRRVRTFLNELEFILPQSIRINRGRMNLRQLFNEANKRLCDRVLLVFNYKGNPDRVIGYEKISNRFEWSFQWNLQQVKLKFELNTKKLSYPPRKWMLVFSGSHLEVENHFKHFFYPILTEKNSITKNDEILHIEILHQPPGFQFQAKNSANSTIPPTFKIREIILLEE